MSTLKRTREDGTNTDEPPRKRHKASNNDNNNSSNKSNNKESRLERESLPIDGCKDEILSLINDINNDIIIITGDTGSGKSTQLSQLLYKCGLYESIIITQPRRIGAVSLAHRVSKEMNRNLGETVGFTIRFQDYSSINTKIKYVTDGILLHEITRNGIESINNKYDIIILDEAHERSLQTDILFSILRDIIKQKRNKFKLLITSATLNVDKFSLFFMNAPVYHINGRCFPVEIFHCTQQQRDYINGCIETALQIHINEIDRNNDGELGHILCFLTGQQEIERAVKLMGDKIDELLLNTNDEIPDCVILSVYGSLPYDKQQRIFANVHKNCRKIIFATNIAETSLTVNNISYVIDPGLVKQKQFNYNTGIDELIINNISKISAIQRKGRAGRTRNGQCYRLYTKQELNEFNDETIPEILRTNLCSTILILKSIGINNINKFEYLDKPNNDAFINAFNKLYLLDAIDKNGNINKNIGIKMTKFPLDPIYSKILIESVQYKSIESALNLVSIISANNNNSSDIFLRPSDINNINEKKKYLEMHKYFDSKYGDIISWLLLFNNFIKIYNENNNNDDMLYEWSRKYYVKYKILRNALKIRNQLKQIINIEFDRDLLLKQTTKPIKSIRKVLAKSLFMQTAFNVNNKNNKYLTFKIYGNTEYNENVYIHPSSMSSLILSSSPSDLKWIIYLDIVYSSKPYMKGICSIKYEWIKTLIPKIGNKIEWIQQKQQQQQQNNHTIYDNNSDNLKDSNISNNKNKTDKKSENNHTKKKKQNNIESVKQRYLKRKMLKNKLKSL